MDHTLALIILPMLKLLKEKKHGSPYVDDLDVPEELGIRSTDDIDSDPEFYSDSNIHARWNWVLDEIIWSFTQILAEDTEPYNAEKYKITQARIDNGLRLFGKYYRGLWD